MKLERSSNRAQVVVVVRGRDAEQGHDFFAYRLVDQPTVRPNDVDGDIAHARDQPMCFRRA